MKKNESVYAMAMSLAEYAKELETQMREYDLALNKIASFAKTAPDISEPARRFLYRVLETVGREVR